MDSLVRYLKTIVEPTVEDFKRNPTSLRHAFLACVAAYHAIDRIAYPRSPGNLRKAWGEESCAFRTVDIIAHDFKHVKSTDRRPHHVSAIPAPMALFNTMPFNTFAFNETGRSARLRHLTFTVQEAVRFLYRKAGQA